MRRRQALKVARRMLSLDYKDTTILRARRTLLRLSPFYMWEFDLVYSIYKSTHMPIKDLALAFKQALVEQIQEFEALKREIEAMAP